MTENAATHDFDWITARAQCSLPNEFVRLRQMIEHNISSRRSLLPSNNAMDFGFQASGENDFSVTRFPVRGNYGGTYSVSFALRNDHILVTDEWSETKLTLTLTLSDDGECRFLVNDGEGECLRWQVVRRALCPIFFQGPGERGGK